MELEGVGGVAVGDLRLEIGGKVDNVDRYREVLNLRTIKGTKDMVAPPKGHFFGQIPHPMHSRSEMKAILDSGETSIQSFPVRTTGHDFLHS